MLIQLFAIVAVFFVVVVLRTTGSCHGVSFGISLISGQAVIFLHDSCYIVVVLLHRPSNRLLIATRIVEV